MDNLPVTGFVRTTLNGIYVEEGKTMRDGFLRFEDKPAFRLTDGKYCVIVDTRLVDGTIYSEVLKVVFVARSLEDLRCGRCKHA